jgi:polyketide cyclase/dehydrase/lipid transport protein
MPTNSRTFDATPEAVWKVLSDGWLYPLWVVGATRMRDVDEHWPEVGARLHHSVGVWPVVVNDNTEVLECSPRRLLKLVARSWPVGEAEVLITLTASGDGTVVEITEDVVRGPGRLVPGPARTLPIKIRNVESLKRLAFLAENREHGAARADGIRQGAAD